MTNQRRHFSGFIAFLWFLMFFLAACQGFAFETAARYETGGTTRYATCAASDAAEGNSQSIPQRAGEAGDGAVMTPSPPEQVRGVYLNSANFYGRKTTETLHYANEAGLNAVVMHVKDPFGCLHWASGNALAQEMKASKGDRQLRTALARYNDAGLWTIAKLDVFQDTLLAEHHLDWAVQNSATGKAWYNHQGLAWGNPHDERVWDYNIALAKEVLALGFDEIQFDYIRFPSDGDLSCVKYPVVTEDKDRVEVIGAFLARANQEIKPLGGVISVDLFGFVAWMTHDFGVGQRIEEIAPHVDAICPMLYPSHFPPNFLGKEDPAQYPREIMEESMKRLKTRTDADIRAWVQGFWYTPEQVAEQIKGIEAAGYESFFIWSPSSRYEVTYEALAAHQGKTLSEPKYYPNLADLAEKGAAETKGVTRVVNTTDYVNGLTVLCLDQSTPEQRSSYTTPRQLADTFDEAILDAILQIRGIESSWKVARSAKVDSIVRLLLSDLGITARTMRAEPIHVAWKGDCRFYRGHELPARYREASVTSSKQPGVASNASDDAQGWRSVESMGGEPSS